MAVKNKSRRKKRMGGNTDMMKMVGDMGQKIIDKHGALVHGDFFKPPPHPHFEKFKKKL